MLKCFQRFGKGFPRKRERKSKETGRKIQAFSFHELSLFRGLYANLVKNSFGMSGAMLRGPQHEVSSAAGKKHSSPPSPPGRSGSPVARTNKEQQVRPFVKNLSIFQR
jgi:hypothetical protein